MHFKLSTIWRGVISFMPGGKASPVSPIMGPGELQTEPGFCVEEKKPIFLVVQAVEQS
jgi:hypothetical protein